jgi:TonB-dependent receptor
MNSTYGSHHTRFAGRHSALRAGTSAVALALLAFAPVAAHAQAEAADAAEEEDAIVVTGIKAQLESSQKIKRDSDTFVDAVTADDIGAFPDRSVTEVLQRVPGVTINRFQGQDDPLHFSVEGANVVIRGLNFVRSEFNGRDAFSVNTGRSLGFTDVSPELLSSVEVYKNGTPDRIEGGISGVVNLNTRKPFDRRKLVIAGTLEANYGDIAQKFTPTFSGLLSNVFETGIGDIGVLVSYSQSRLKSTSYGTQLDEYQYRPDLSTTLTEQRYVPRGAGARTQDFNRFRNTFDASLQWEATDGSAKLTVEYIRALSTLKWAENVIELDNFTRPTNDGERTRTFGGPANAFVYGSDGLFESGGITNGGLSPLNITRRNQNTRSVNEDFSANLQFNPTDRLSFTFDGQYATAKTGQFDIGLLTSVDTDVGAIIDRTAGLIPSVTFAPINGSDPATFFANPANVFYRAVLDHQEESEGDEFAFRADAKYDFDEGFLKALRVGGRYSDREQTRRYTNYAWGFISQNWTGPADQGGGLSPLSAPGSVGTIAPFSFPNFQRGQVSTPVNTVYSTLDLAQAYSTGEFQSLVRPLLRGGCCSGGLARFLVGRDGVIPGTPYLPGEINVSREETFAAHARADFQVDGIFGENTALNGNVGVRYVNTRFQTAGSETAGIASRELQFIDVNNNGTIEDSEVPASGRANRAPTAAAIAAECARIGATNVGNPSSRLPLYCALSPALQQRYFAFLSGGSTDVNARNSYDDFLPSVNLNLKLGDKFIVRAAFQKAISRPDFGRTGYSVGYGGNDNFRVDPTLPLFSSGGADPQLGSIKSDNYDLGFEYYFAKDSSLTLNLFYKRLSDLIAGGEIVRQFTNANGVTEDVLFGGPRNIGKGKIKGFEVGYSQFYSFLPGPLSGLGFQGNFTYVEPSNFLPQVTESTYRGLSYPLEGLSKYTFNASALYEKYGISARASYNWRSQYLLTARDVIIPFAPIYVPDGGQLDASLFYSITPQIKVGVQAANLLNQTTRTLQQTTYDATGDAVGTANYTPVAGPLAPRSFFQNDRRFTFGVRFNF